MLTIILVAVFYYYPISQGQIPESPFDKISILANKIWHKIKSTELSIPKLPDSKPSSSGPVTVYRWQDTSGQWHFSNTPPAQSEKPANYSSLVVNPDSNVIQSIQPSRNENENKTSPDKHSNGSAKNEQLNPYSKETIEQLFKQTETIRKNMQQREQIMQDLNQTTP